MMQQSIGRKPTQIETEAMQAICKLQDENRELRLEIQRLREAISLSGVAKTMAQYVAEIERLQAKCNALTDALDGADHLSYYPELAEKEPSTERRGE